MGILEEGCLSKFHNSLDSLKFLWKNWSISFKACVG